MGTKKFLGILLLVISVISIFPIQSALADQGGGPYTQRFTPEQNQALSEAPSSFFGWIASEATMWVTEQIMKFFGFLIQLEAKVLSWVVDKSHFTTLGVVQQGWKICRDFANLFFIAVLIYIAFSLILKLQKGDPKKLLFKVIAMAIIINFSLMIGGIIIDFSQVLFRYFIFAPLTEKNGVGFSQQLANQLVLNKMLGSEYDPASGTITAGAKAILNTGDTFLKMVFIIVFFALVSIVFGAIAITLFIRNFWLWILLILSPLAWFLGMVPVGISSKYASQWWSNFLKWCFMAPIMGFFVYLSFMILTGSDTGEKIVDEEKLKNQWQTNEAQKGSQEQIFSFQKSQNTIFNPANIFHLLTSIAFLVAGLMAGQSLGSGAAKGAMGMVNKAQKGVQKWAGRRATNNPLTRGSTSFGAKGLNTLTTVPVIGRAFKGSAVKMAAKRDELRKEKGQLGKKFDSEQLKKMWESGNLNEQEKVEAAKKIGFDKLNQKQFEEMQNIYSRKGMGYDKEKKDLEKAAPHFTKEFAEEAQGFNEARQDFSAANAEINADADAEYKKIDNELQAIEKEKAEYEKQYNSLKDSKLIDMGVEEKKKEIEQKINALGDSKKAAETRRQAVKDTVIERKEKARGKFEQARVPIMERFQETDLAKLSELSNVFKNLESPQAQALIDVMAHKPIKSVIKALPKIKTDDATGTADLRRRVTTSMAENLYLDGGVEAVIKLNQLDTSPGAKAGHYDFKNTVKEMKIDEEMKKKINDAAHKRKKTDKILKDIAENIEKSDEKGPDEKKEEKTEDKGDK